MLRSVQLSSVQFSCESQRRSFWRGEPGSRHPWRVKIRQGEFNLRITRPNGECGQNLVSNVANVPFAIIFPREDWEPSWKLPCSVKLDVQHFKLADMNHSNDTGQGLSHSILCRILSPGIVTNTVLVVAYVTLLFAACVENATVIHLVRTYKDLRQSTFNLLIINMAVADLIDVCFATTVSVSFVFVGRQWIPGLAGKISCKLVYYILVMSIGLSISTLVIMSVDRYMAIVHAMKKPMSSAAAKRCIAVSWIISAIASSPYLYKMETSKIDDGTTICGSIWSNDPVQHMFYSKLEGIIKALIFYVLPLIVIGTTNIVISYRLRKRPSLGGNRTQEIINIQNQKIYKLLVANVALFAFLLVVYPCEPHNERLFPVQLLFSPSSRSAIFLLDMPFKCCS